MTNAFVQSFVNSNAGARTSVTINLASSATANNLLVAIWGCRNDPGAITGPSGWTEIYKAFTSSTGYGLWYKIADGTETTVTVSNVDSQRQRFGIVEYSGLATSGVLEANSINTSFAAENSQSADTAISPGSISPTTADGRAHLGIAGRTEADVGGGSGPTIGSSYVTHDYVAGNTGSRPWIVQSSLGYTTTGAQNPAVTADSGEPWGCVPMLALFKEAAAGGLTGIRNPMNGPVKLRSPLGRRH